MASMTIGVLHNDIHNHHGAKPYAIHYEFEDTLWIFLF